MEAHTSANPEDKLPEHPERATLEGRNKVLGFWFFLGGETVLFSCLFGTYLAVQGGTAGVPGPSDIFHLDFVFMMTVLLLTSSLTSVLAVWAMQRNQYVKMQAWFAATVLLGLGFLGMEIIEFVQYVGEGLGYTTSSFSSGFYTLVGFHGAHVLFGVCWIIDLQLQAISETLKQLQHYS
jgi:cytochrome c oxidase subunit III